MRKYQNYRNLVHTKAKAVDTSFVMGNIRYYAGVCENISENVMQCLTNLSHAGLVRMAENNTLRSKLSLYMLAKYNLK